jgi:predicted phosphoribosyltransferase
MQNATFDRGPSDIQRAFHDRREAGELLASRLRRFAHRDDVIVLALPRGGVPVAYEVARDLGVPLDVFTVRKLGVPGHEELAMGAIASGGAQVLNLETLDALRIPRASIVHTVDEERRELARREHLYRDSRPYPELEGKTVILVDDGLATGASMLVAVVALRQKHPSRVVVAVPVAARDVADLLRRHADEVVCYVTPEPLSSVGSWYEDFSQVADGDVRALLNRAALAR